MLDLNIKRSALPYVLHPLNLLSTGISSTAACYRLRDSRTKMPTGYVVKYFEMHDSLIECEVISEEEVEKFSTIDFKHYVFPVGRFYVDGKYVGVIAPFISGKTLSERNGNDINFSSICKQEESVSDDASKLASMHWCLNDAYLSNFKYNRGLFRFIDTCDSAKVNNLSEDEIHSQIMRGWTCALVNFMIKGLVLNFAKDNSVLRSKLFLNAAGKTQGISYTSMGSFVGDLEEELSSSCGCSVKKIGDASSFLKSRYK